jgi:hypothetical protein
LDFFPELLLHRWVYIFLLPKPLLHYAKYP